MAKFAIIFTLISVLCIQYALSARIVRDAPETAGDAAKNIQKTLEDAVGQLQNFIKTNLSQEQLEKFGKELQAFGEQVGTKGKELFEQADESFKKLQQKDGEH